MLHVYYTCNENDIIPGFYLHITLNMHSFISVSFQYLKVFLKGTNLRIWKCWYKESESDEYSENPASNRT